MAYRISLPPSYQSSRMSSGAARAKLFAPSSLNWNTSSCPQLFDRGALAVLCTQIDKLLRDMDESADGERSPVLLSSPSTIVY